MAANPQKNLFRFGVFEADPATGELRKQGRRLPLQGQPFDILVLLLEHAGEVVSRTQIQERLWSDGTFVDFDHSLNTAVNKIRDVLGDSASSPRYVETLARRGYRFIAPVQVDDETARRTVPSSSSTPQLDSGLSPAAATEQPRTSSPTLLTAQHEVPQTHGTLVTTLFLLLQLMYLSFYILALARLHAIDETLAATVSHPVWVVVGLIVTAVVGIPIRLYLISTAAFRAPGLRQKFLRLFAIICPLDELWALAPFLLVPQIGYGLALGLTAILLYVPFAERSLILMGAGDAPRAQAARS